MPSLAKTTGLGQYVAGEKHVALRSRLYRHNGTRRPIIFFPGGVGGHLAFLVTPINGSQITPVLADAGYPMISADLGGGSDWGNDEAQTRIGQAWTQVKAELSTATDKMLLVGVSQGATAALNYAKNNPTNVAAVACLVPAVDIQDIYDNDRAGAAAGIAAAYGGSRPPDTHNPADNTAALSGIPIKLWYATDDTIIFPATVTDFAAAVGATAVSLGAVGHTAETIPAKDVLTFFDSV